MPEVTFARDEALTILLGWMNTTVRVRALVDAYQPFGSAPAENEQAERALMKRLFEAVTTVTTFEVYKLYHFSNGVLHESDFKAQLQAANPFATRGRRGNNYDEFTASLCTTAARLRQPW